MDVIASSLVYDKLAWYENMIIIGIEENEIASFTIYPNPVKDFLNIESSAGVTIKTTILYDALGRELFKKENEASHLSFGNYAAGIYFLKLDTNTGEQVFKVIKN